MQLQEIREHFLKKFDVVGIIRTIDYMKEARKKYPLVEDIKYATMVVLGLSYPKIDLKHTKTHLVASFYTFGNDYHQVLKHKIEEVMTELKIKYDYGVDNHAHDERLAAAMAGVGYLGKNQLIINKNYGSYLFLGLVYLDLELEENFILDIDDNCGTCTLCIQACPTKALSNTGFAVDKCISAYNQTKKILNEDEIKNNHLLLGCDICQVVCPKNINKKAEKHSEFDLSGKEMVSIIDLFTLSNKEFFSRYQHMSYLWKGKTILMRNALLVMLRQKNKLYLDLIEDSINKTDAFWYKDTAVRVLNKLKKTDMKNQT